jgi:hypothetical protein
MALSSRSRIMRDRTAVRRFVDTYNLEKRVEKIGFKSP